MNDESQEYTTRTTMDVEGVLEGPATHLCLVSIACRSYEKKPDFAGPPWLSTGPNILQGSKP
jgi:hypothetical protein